MYKLTPMVSVCMITYNHEAYIREAIEGVLMQQTTFSTELIIGEDCSTDNTRGIVNEYESKYPDIIVAQYPEINRGMMKNFITVMQSARGKYIALCEGDDYWTDPLKLQKQVDFLEENEEYSFCCNSSSEVNSDGVEYKVSGNKGESTITLPAVLREGWFIRTASIVLRSEALSDGFPSFFSTAYSTDYILQIMLLKQGNAYFMSDKMSAYRSHDGGISHTNRVNQLKRWKQNIDLFNTLDEYTSYNYTNEIKHQQSEITMAISWNLIYWLPKSIQIGVSFWFNNFKLSSFIAVLKLKIQSRFGK